MSMTQAQAKELGKLIAAARIKKGLSLRDIEERLGIARAWLGRLEQGQTLSVVSDRLARIADLLDIEPARIDRATKGAVSDGLPEVRTYFRAKYGLSAADGAQIDEYARQFIDPPEEHAA